MDFLAIAPRNEAARVAAMRRGLWTTTKFHRALVGALASFLAMIAVSAFGDTVKDALVESQVVLDGIPLKIRRSPRTEMPGKYLLTLNDVPHVVENKPPYRAFVMSIGTDGKADVFRKYRSDKRLIWAVDLKPQPDGTYSYALNRPRPPRWIHELRHIDPSTGDELIDLTPQAALDPGLDGHETMVPAGDKRLFLYYRDRNEGGANYIDMEIGSVSVADGRMVMRWSSRGRFPATMTGDYLHFNAIFPLPENRVLASARATNTLYIINLLTGNIEDQINSQTWRIVGDPLNGFARQHFAHFRENGNLMMFDNRDAAEARPTSRAVEYAVDWQARILRMVWERRADSAMNFRYGWGSASAIGGDEVLVGWGDYPRTPGHCASRTGFFPVFSHVSRDGKTLFELSAPCGWATYRVYFVGDTAPASSTGKSSKAVR